MIKGPKELEIPSKDSKLRGGLLIETTATASDPTSTSVLASIVVAPAMSRKIVVIDLCRKKILSLALPSPPYLFLLTTQLHSLSTSSY